MPDAFDARQAFADQNLSQALSLHLDQNVIPCFSTSASSACPKRAQDECLLQKFLHPLFGLNACLHRLIKRDTKMQTLLARPFRIHKSRFGRIHKIESRPEFLLAAVYAEAVAIVVFGIDVLAIGQCDPFLFTGPSLSG